MHGHKLGLVFETCRGKHMKDWYLVSSYFQRCLCRNMFGTYESMCANSSGLVLKCRLLTEGKFQVLPPLFLYVVD